MAMAVQKYDIAVPGGRRGGLKNVLEHGEFAGSTSRLAGRLAHSTGVEDVRIVRLAAVGKEREKVAEQLRTQAVKMAAGGVLRAQEVVG